MILNMRSIISNGADSGDEADSADEALPNELIRMTTRQSNYNDRLGGSEVAVNFTKVDTVANYDNELSTTFSSERREISPSQYFEST